MTDNLDIPPVPQDAKMLPEPLSFRINALAQLVASGFVLTDERHQLATALAAFADEAEALEALAHARRK